MTKNTINSGAITDMTNNVTDYSSNNAPSTTEMEYQGNWDKAYGIYLDVPFLAALIDKKAMWTVGKGFKAKKSVMNTLKNIRGNGKQTINGIMNNMVKTYTIGGDFFAEIVKDGNKLINLKPLNPAMIKIVANSSGIIIRYEQFNNKKTIHKWKPEKIFHLPWNSIADQIHGNSTVLKLKWTAEAYKESKSDMRIVFHRYVKPLIISHVDTDDETEIAAYKRKLDSAVELGENLVIPFDTLKSMDKMSIPQFSSLDPLPWMHVLERDFIVCEGVPAVIAGSGEEGDTEAEAKMLYLAYQQVIETNQMFIEENFETQLGLKIELEFPASLETTMQDDQSKARKMNNMETGIGNASGGKK